MDVYTYLYIYTLMSHCQMVATTVHVYTMATMHRIPEIADLLPQKSH